MQGVRILQLDAEYQKSVLSECWNYSGSGTLLISRAISQFILPLYSISKNFSGIILYVFRFSSPFRAYRYSLVWQENTDLVYSMFEVHKILNIDVSLSQVAFIQSCGKTGVKLKSSSIPQRIKV